MANLFILLAKKKTLFLLLTFFLLTATLRAQTLPVGLLENVEDAYRRTQLLGMDTSKSSYLIRPLQTRVANSHALQTGDAQFLLLDFRKKLWSNDNEKIAIYALPIVWQNQYNSHHPYGMNDGAMIGAKGFQAQFSAGLYAKIGPLSIQLRPEVVYAANESFTQTFENDNGASFRNAYLTTYVKIDLPERFGAGRYTNLNWGQSSIRLTFDPVSIGLSNENLWWGPGVRNSLLMSNNAAGFKHLTLNTSKPVQTYVGSFEAQIIGGRLNPSNVELPYLTEQKPRDWRYISGIAVTWQPKWVPNLYLGFDRVYVTYRSLMERNFSGYFPIFSAFEKKSYAAAKVGDQNLEDVRKADQLLSFFARWVLPESKAEIYFEYGRNDHAWDLRDAFIEPEHSQAYIVGFRKLVPLAKSTTEFIQVGVEFTQLQSTSTRTVRASPPWYAQYTAGYTNEGQVLGAGIGPGSNMQSISTSWVKGLKRIGLSIERTVHDNDLYYNAFGSGTNSDFRRHWVDLSFIGNVSWDYKKFILNANAGYIRSLNYQYQFSNQSKTDIFVWDKADVNNFHLKLGLMYRW